MEIFPNDLDLGSFLSVTTKHGDQALVWSTVTYNKLKFFNLGRIFKELNEFWATLPEESQAEIFDAYKEIYEALKEVDDARSHLDAIRTQVKRIYKYYTKENLDEIMKGVEVAYTSSMTGETNYVGGETRTYRKPDYDELVKLALRLRPMVPIFGQYVRLVRDHAGTHYKESAAVGLLKYTDVLECPAMDRLVRYMESNLANFQHRATAVMGNMGSDQVPYWLAERSIFRRVALGEVDSGSDNSSIVTNVHNFVKSQLDSLPRNFGSVVRAKTRVNEGAATNEENISVLESFKIRQQISDGDKVMVNVYCRDPIFIAQRVDPSISAELVDACTRITGSWASQVIQEHQKLLVKWVLSAAMPPSYFDVIGRESALRCIGATQALLYHWGYINIAALMTAIPLDDPNSAPMTSLWQRDSITNETKELLRERFPYYRQPTKKDQTLDDVNEGNIAVNAVADAVYQSDWILHEPEWLIAEVKVSDVNTILIPPDFRNQLAHLLLRCTAD